MTRRGYAKRRDFNEPQIIAALVAAGCVVDRMEPPALDLLVGTPDGRIVVMEVKDPAKDKRYGKVAHGNLTPSQRAWIDRWAGYPVHVVRSPQEALEAVRGAG